MSDTKAIARSKSAVVLQKRHSSPNGDILVYGCMFRKGAVYRLNIEGEFGAAYVYKPIVLRGRYVAYILGFDSAAGGDTIDVTVRDLVTGKVVGDTLANNRDFEDSPVYRLVMNRRGYTAWTSSDRDSDPTVYELHILTRGHKSKLVDHGPTIDRSSLRLGRDGRSISWRKAGRVRHARLG